MARARQPIQIGVIGAGFMAQVAHLPAFARLSDCRLAALADNRPDLLTAVADRFNIEKRFADYGELLADPAIEAVVVSMPRRAQSAVVRDALRSGRPVLTEKPLAYTTEVADSLVTLAQAKNIPLAVGYMRRFDTGVAKFREVFEETLSDGKLGALLAMRVQDFCGAYPEPVPDHVRCSGARPFRYQEDATAPEFLDAALRDAYDYTVNVASHDIDLLSHLLGDPLEPISFRVRPGGAQHAVLSWRDIDIALSVAPARLGRWEQRLDAYFERGRLGLILESPLASDRAATVGRQDSTGEQTLLPAAQDTGGTFDRQAAGFLDAVRVGGKMAADGSEAVRDLAVIEGLWRIASVA